VSLYQKKAQTILLDPCSTQIFRCPFKGLLLMECQLSFLDILFNFPTCLQHFHTWRAQCHVCPAWVSMHHHKET